MDIKVLFSRGDGVYVIELDDGFYLINLESGTISERKKYIDSFLKFGYFYPIDKIEASEMESIKELFASQRYVSTSAGTTIIGKL